jgi:hypothetical protein
MEVRKSAPRKAMAALAATLALLTLWGAGEATANSRLTVENQAAGNLMINLFNGNDSTCIAPNSQKTVQSGATDGMGCNGNGTHRCLVEIRWESESGTGRACAGDLYQSCGNRKAIHVANRATVTVESDGSCTINNP